MENFSAKIKSITLNPDKGFDITITVINESEFDLLLDQEREWPYVSRDKTYIININGNEMMHPSGGEIIEIMEVYHKFEYSDNLNPSLRRMWRTGLLIDNIAHKIISSGILNKTSDNEINNKG